MTFFDADPMRYWLKLRPRPRTDDFGTALQALIEDPLWMLTRQSQLGEYHGEDAGSAVMATLAHRTSPVAATRIGAGAAQPYDPAVPLEPRVERLPIDFPPALRAHVGRHLFAILGLRLGEQPYSPALRHALTQGYGVAAPAPATGDPVALARAATGGLGGRVQRALAGRAFDGVAFAATLPPGLTLADVDGSVTDPVDPTDHPTLLAALTEFRDWFDRLYAQPDPPDASGWDGTRLEYDYGVTVTRETGPGLDLAGATSVTGRIDWYCFDVAGPSDATVPASPPWSVTGVVPGPVTFAGMPNARWWQFEDGAVSLGSLQADATDLAKMLAADFALVYGNDWLSVPLPQPIGVLAEIAGIVVTDVFGTRTLVRAATGASGDDWSAWDLFSLGHRHPGLPALGQHLFVPPTTSGAAAGPTLEEATFVRDEAADLVWAVETTVPNGLGGSRDGADAARALQRVLYPAVESTGPTGLRYILGTSVPENWIPFVPASTAPSSIQLQRAWMPRPVPARPRVRPVTTILRPGLSADDQATGAYIVHEAEVPRAGVRVRGAMQRARWTDGSTVVWHARQRRAGRGEGSSGLRFDVLEPDDNPPAPSP